MGVRPARRGRGCVASGLSCGQSGYIEASARAQPAAVSSTRCPTQTPMAPDGALTSRMAPAAERPPVGMRTMNADMNSRVCGGAPVEANKRRRCDVCSAGAIVSLTLGSPRWSPRASGDPAAGTSRCASPRLRSGAPLVHRIPAAVGGHQRHRREAVQKDAKEDGQAHRGKQRPCLRERRFPGRSAQRR